MTVFDLCQRWRAGETSINNDGDLFLLGNEQSRVLRALGDDLAPINREYFTARHLEGQVPLIMNYYNDATHGRIKREHLTRMHELMNIEFSYRLANHIQRTFKDLAREGEVDLVVAVTESVIRFNLHEFINFDASNEEIRVLAYFEDYFTMGLYLDSDTLDGYYDTETFTKSKRTFHSLVDRWRQAADFPDAYGMHSGFTPMDFFYNFSIAGSTNVAKGFVYGLQLLAEQSVRRNPPTAEAMLKELLRFLPFVDNHVVPCFLARRPTEKGRQQLAKAGYGDVQGNVYLFHTLHHANPESFQNPDHFNPWRWYHGAAKVPLTTFGVGAHACCGSRLAEVWLLNLFEVWRANYRLDTPIAFRSDPFAYSVPLAQRLTSTATVMTH